jgi:uncharacterized Zn-finger protein
MQVKSHTVAQYPVGGSSVEQNASVVKKTLLFNYQHCSKFFAHASKLNRHLTVHTGKKPYSCTLCKKTFAWSDQLTAHCRKTHQEEVDANSGN